MKIVSDNLLKMLLCAIRKCSFFFFLVFLLLMSCKEDDPAPMKDDPSEQEEPAEVALYKPTLDQPRSIIVNASGYNPRNFIYQNPWTNTALDQKFQLGLVNSEANIIRYPGGTFGNFWNYRGDKLFRSQSTLDPIGWVYLNKVENERTNRFIKNDNANINSVDDLKFAAKGGDSGKPVNVVFVMNMVTPGMDFYEWEWGRPVDGTVGSADWYAMLDDRYDRFKGMLLRAKGGDDPIDVRFIELGNEYYFPHAYCVEAFPTGADFGLACNYIAGKLKNDEDLNLAGRAAIAATASCVGGSDNRTKEWNSSLQSALDNSKVGYVTLHVYQAYEEPSTYTEFSFQSHLVDWYEKTDLRFSNSGADDTFISGNWPVWYTEANANWDASVTENTSSAEATWGQNLVDVVLVQHLYAGGNAAMVLQFQFNNQVIPGTDGALYNRAIALKPYMLASRNAVAAARISFSGTNMPNLPNYDKKVVQGLAFIDAEGNRRCLLINLSSSVKHLNLANIYTDVNHSELNLEAYNNLAIDGAGSPNHYVSVYPKTDVELQPYSVNYLRAK